MDGVHTFTSFFIVDFLLFLEKRSYGNAYLLASNNEQWNQTNGSKRQSPRDEENLEIRRKKNVNVAVLQVIQRPGPSTSGRSDQQRLFLRMPCFYLRRLSGPSTSSTGARTGKGQ